MILHLESLNFHRLQQLSEGAQIAQSVISNLQNKICTVARPGLLKMGICILITILRQFRLSEPAAGLRKFHMPSSPPPSTGRLSRATPPPRIALLVPAWNEYGRGIIEGVWQYAQQHSPWLIEMQPGELDESTDMPRGWAGDGMIAAVQTRRLAVKLRTLGVPIVNVSGSRGEGIDFPRVTSDAKAVVRMALAHLQEKGLKHIAFCGEPQRPFLDFWTEAFQSVMAENGMEALVYQPSPRIGPKAGVAVKQKDRRRWIEELPKPVGIIGWATDICRHLAMACTELGVMVPEEVAIVSLETEDLLGRVVHPPLSGVDIPVRRIGYEAAAQLDRMLHGKAADPHEINLQPLGVTTRQSTDLVACADLQVQQVLRFIRDHAHEGIDVRAVLKAVPMARRSLERRFHDLIGRSPAEEIRRVKINRVRHLLDTTNMSIPDIAESCGFNYVEHMIPVFKKHHGDTPSRYRANARLGL
jgi:LacI family transcriptional regulator